MARPDNSRLQLIISRCLAILAVGIAVLLSLIKTPNSLITTPLIGCVSAMLLLFFFRYACKELTIRLALSYILALIVNQLMLSSFKIGIGELNIFCLYHFPILACLFIAFIIRRKNIFKSGFNFTKSIILTFIILSLHILSTFLMLQKTFGFGYESSLGVLATVAIFGASLAIIANLLEDRLVFKATSLITCLYFLVLIFT